MAGGVIKRFGAADILIQFQNNNAEIKKKV
jgi:hypothetical protein